MKKTIVVLLAMTTISAGTTTSDFCEGWNDGYVDGWCYRRPNCYEPYVPYCPYPDWDEDNYKGGYQRGFIQGQKDRD